MKPVRVLLAEDHTLVRAGIAALLRSLKWVELVGQANHGREALELIDVLRPDLVLMDIGMPQLNGLQATSHVTKHFPGIRVLILSMHPNPEYVAEAVRAGAAGYLLKGADVSELELAIKAVARGEAYFSPWASTVLARHYRQGTPADQGGTLTPRQREILQLIAEGRTTKEIAQVLKVSVKTAETHRAQLMDRLDIHDIAGLVRYAIRSGMVPSEP